MISCGGSSSLGGKISLSTSWPMVLKTQFFFSLLLSNCTWWFMSCWFAVQIIKTKEMAMDWIYNCKLDAPIGSQFVYSDISFILLGEIVERVSGITLNENVKANL